jgi:hypothetical protein
MSPFPFLFRFVPFSVSFSVSLFRFLFWRLFLTRNIERSKPRKDMYKMDFVSFAFWLSQSIVKTTCYMLFVNIVNFVVKICPYIIKTEKTPAPLKSPLISPELSLSTLTATNTTVRISKILLWENQLGKTDRDAVITTSRY